MIEYRLECRYGSDAKWQPMMDRQVWTGENAKTRVIKAWVWEVANTPKGIWRYRIVGREVTEWEPIENMDEALLVAEGGQHDA